MLQIHQPLAMYLRSESIVLSSLVVQISMVDTEFSGYFKIQTATEGTAQSSLLINGERGVLLKHRLFGSSTITAFPKSLIDRVNLPSRVRQMFPKTNGLGQISMKS